VHSRSDAGKPRIAEPDRSCLHDYGCSDLVVDYASQLSFIQPALLLGEAVELSSWTQYNPHGVFIAFENVGYLLFNLA